MPLGIYLNRRTCIILLCSLNVIFMPKPTKHATRKSGNKAKAKHAAKRVHVKISPSKKAHIQHGKAGKNVERQVQHGKKHASNSKHTARILPKAPAVTAKQVIIKESVKERREKEAEAMMNEQRKHDIKVVEDVFVDSYFTEHFTAVMGDRSVDVIKALYKKPQTDEKLTEKLEMKINEVRKVLNVMNGQGITKYDVTKDSSGWLIFTWRIDAEKLSEYVNKQKTAVPASENMLPENCNDFFMCKKCYGTNMTVLPFDSAVEYSFKCSDCGGKLEMIDRQNAELFVKGLKK